MIAYCFRDGVVGFGQYIPKGAIKIIEGNGRGFRERIQIKCRLAYDGKTHLVPGVPEAENDADAFSALERFVKWVKM